MGFFESLEQEEEKEEKKVTPKRTYTPKPKKDNFKFVLDFSTVVNSIHVNLHTAQRETLTKIVGSYKVADVRKYLIDKFMEAFEQ